MKHDHAQFSSAQTMPQPMHLPQILILRPDQTYVGPDRYAREFSGYGRLHHGDALKLLFRLPSGEGYIQAREMSELDAIKGTAHLKRALEAARLPMTYAGSARHAVPPVLSQVEEDRFVPGLSGNTAPGKIFIERASRNSLPGTGSFISLLAHLMYHPRGVLTAEQRRILGPLDGFGMPARESLLPPGQLQSDESNENG